MVDAVVSFVVERVGDYLIREAAFLGEVRNEVESLKNELELMQCFIKDAEEKQSDSHAIRKWVSDIIDIAYDTEDLLDDFFLEASIKNILNKAKETVKLRGIGQQIANLKKRIDGLKNQRATYGLLNDIHNKSEAGRKAVEIYKGLRRSQSYVADEVVGFEDDAKKLLDQLLNNDPRRFVISILGTGGLGKTTLARKLYWNEAVQRKFTCSCSAWVSVSQDYQIADLLQRLIKSFGIDKSNADIEKMKEEDMERLLHDFLKDRSYLVVMDDVWQKEDWEILKKALPDNKKGSRVIITTRK